MSMTDELTKLEEKNGISARFLSYIKQIDQTIDFKIAGPEATLSEKAINTGKAFNDKHQVLSRANTYYEKALSSPFGQKVYAFYSSTSKQVVDIHDEARRIAEVHKAEKGPAVSSNAASTSAPLPLPDPTSPSTPPN
ncbi:hypothetical protein FRB90_007859 [Tulasnella sp. 427]|nr:hypothetical protein FRB90_007859 [Tulasnella sp. 427]